MIGDVVGFEDVKDLFMTALLVGKVHFLLVGRLWGLTISLSDWPR